MGEVCGDILTLLQICKQKGSRTYGTLFEYLCGSCLVADDALREEEHAQHDAHGKHDSHDDGQSVEVLLHDARGRAGVIQRASDHIRNAGTFTRMQQDEDNKSDARKNEQDGKDDCEY